MNKAKKKILVLIIIFLGIGLFAKIMILDNEDGLFSIAAGLDVPSKSYYFVIERIYKISETKNIGDKILGYLEGDKNKHLHNLYVKTLGIIGEYYSSTFLLKAYSKYQHDMNHRSTLSQIINSMGLIGNEDLVPLLETLLKDHDKLDVQVTKYSIARALYFITGKSYSYTNQSGERTQLHVTDELAKARRVIVNSKKRRRTLDEILTLDKLYRPPERGIKYR